MKKIFTSFVAGVLMLGLVVPVSASAQTSVADQLAQIQALTTQIKALQDQINSLQKQQLELQSTAQQTAFAIASGLNVGAEGDQVALLQTLLSLDNTIYPEGKVTGYFGPMTRLALQRFQQKNGLEGVGFVGPRTRNALEKLFKAHFAEAREIEDDIEDEVEDAVEAYLASLPVIPDSSCAIPGNPYASSSPFIQKDGKTKIISNGNSLIYKDGKHKIVITPNSYIEKNGKKQLIITPGYRIEKDGKNKTFIRCSGGVATTTPPFPFPNPTPNDTTPPTLSSIQSSATHQSASISWITNESATGKVYYGTSTPLNTGTAWTKSDNSLQTGHSFNLSNLTATTTYYFIVESKDKKGNTATSSQMSFTTGAAPDTAAPSISAVGFSVSTSTATITWTTNENANSKVYYGTVTPLNTGSALTKSSATMVTSHSLQLTGLTPNTTYYFKVESKDSSNNGSMSSETSFTTAALPADTTAPIISSTAASNIGSTTATIGWTTNEAANSKVYYGTVSPLATSTAFTVSNSSLVTGHSLGLSGLTASTTYYAIVESKDASNNTASGSEFSFTTAQ